MLHPARSWKPVKSQRPLFWDEFPTFLLIPSFSRFMKLNGKSKSSEFMWALTVCYDKESAAYNQPDEEKWGFCSEEIFGESNYIYNEFTSEDTKLKYDVACTATLLKIEFEKAIDSVMGYNLRILENKFVERTAFLQNTKYSADAYKEINGKNVLIKGTADQLDKMFANTDKITSLIQNIMKQQKASELGGSAKGGGQESLGDGDSSF